MRVHRPVVVVVVLAALLAGGCQREQSFDDRYAKADEAIRARAAQMDADLAERERQAAEAAAVASGSVRPRR